MGRMGPYTEAIEAGYSISRPSWSIDIPPTVSFVQGDGGAGESGDLSDCNKVWGEKERTANSDNFELLSWYFLLPMPNPLFF